jgi:hypothetical protein
MAILGYKKSAQSIRSFGLAEWLETRGFAGWLEIATDGLEAPARQRVAKEIGTHYAESVSAHMVAGLAQLSAQSTALAELGDPEVAARNFKKSHLTESDVKSMKWMERMSAKPLFSFRMLPLDLLPLAGLALLCSRSHRTLLLWLLAIYLLVEYVGFRLIPRLLYAKRLPRTSFLKGLALSTFLTEAAFGSCYAVLFCAQNHNIYASGFIGLFVVLRSSLSSNFSLRIWNKLRKMGDARNDPPPRQTPAS